MATIAIRMCVHDGIVRRDRVLVCGDRVGGTGSNDGGTRDVAGGRRRDEAVGRDEIPRVQDADLLQEHKRLLLRQIVDAVNVCR